MPPMGSIINVAATCDKNTNRNNKVVCLLLYGNKQSAISVRIVDIKPMRYHFFKLNVVSAIGPHKKRQIFANKPKAIMLADNSTGNPFCVNKYGSVMLTKP